MLNGNKFQAKWDISRHCSIMIINSYRLCNNQDTLVIVSQ